MGGVIRVIGWNGPAFLRAGVAAGLSSHRRHQFLEAHQVQHPFEVVGQRRQAPFALHLRQALEQKVGVCVFQNRPTGRRSAASLRGGILGRGGTRPYREDSRPATSATDLGTPGRDAFCGWTGFGLRTVCMSLWCPLSFQQLLRTRVPQPVARHRSPGATHVHSGEQTPFSLSSPAILSRRL